MFEKEYYSDIIGKVFTSYLGPVEDTLWILIFIIAALFLIILQLKFNLFGPVFTILRLIFGSLFGKHHSMKPPMDANSRFMNKKEIQKTFLSKPEGKDSILIDGKRMWLPEPFTGFLVSGATGSMKSAGILLPTLLSLQHSSASVVDISGELLKHSGHRKLRDGYEINVLHLTNPALSSGFNPLMMANTALERSYIAGSLIHASGKAGEQFWYQGSESLVLCVLEALCNVETKYRNLPNLLHLLERWNDKNFPEFIKKNSSERNQSLYLSLCENPDKILGSFLSIARNSLRFVNFSPEVASLLTRNEIGNFQEMRHKKSITYLVVSPQLLDIYYPIVNMYFSLLFYNLLKEVPEPEMLPIFVFLDEMANIGRIPSMLTNFTIARKHKVSISAFLQDLLQLSMVYGKDAASIIANGGCRSRLYLTSGDEGAFYLERILGKQSTESPDGFTRETPLMNAQSLRLLNKQAVFTSTGSLPCFIPQITGFFENPQFDKVLQEPYEPKAKTSSFTEIEYYPLGG